jgi:hypothetical protein
MKLRPICFAALLPLAACAPTDGSQDRDIRAPAATALGEPENCVTRSNIRNTKVWDDYTIDFEMTGGRTYRNTLDSRCGGLGFEERFGYETSLNQLCSTDIIYVLENDARRGASCGLGKFVPVEVSQN